MTDLPDLLRRASAYIQASVRTVVVDGDEEPATESDHEAHKLACECAHESGRVDAALTDAYAEGRKDEREEFVRMLREELASAKEMAKGNGGNPRYDYFADCIEMLIGNVEEPQP